MNAENPNDKLAELLKHASMSDHPMVPMRAPLAKEPMQKRIAAVNFLDINATYMAPKPPPTQQQTDYLNTKHAIQWPTRREGTFLSNDDDIDNGPR